MANNYAVIQNGVVSAVIFATSPDIVLGSVLIDGISPTPGVGWSYANGIFTAPDPGPAPTPTGTMFTQKAFMDLFTQAELKTCFAYETSANLTDDQKANLRVFFKYFDHTEPIDMTMATTVAGVQMLEAYGLIGAGRAAQILASRN